MPTAPVNGIEIEYESFGEEGDPPLLLVAGLGEQLISWRTELCLALVDRGFRVVRFDNRDVGLSTKLAEIVVTRDDLLAALAGGDIERPYRVSDMAADAVGLLDHLGIDAAHVVGRSMGGVIAQTIAIEHPSRVLSLTSIMSTSGAPDVGQPEPEAMAVLVTPRPDTREQAIEQGVASRRVIGSPDHFDEDDTAEYLAAAYDRCHDPDGFARQLLAVAGAGDRTERLGAVDVPTLVIHGDRDPLVTLSGGEATAAAVPGAELLVLEGMGHDLPPTFWAPVVEAITKLAARAAA